MKLSPTLWLTLLALGLHTSILISAENLSIVSATPRGELRQSREASQISITFNQPMTALSQGEIQKPDWFKIEPAVSGTYQWVGTSTLSFRPDTLLPNATTYFVTVSGTLSSTNGNQLGKAFKYSFQTPRPRVRYVKPRNKSTSIDIRTQITIQFNIPVIPGFVRKHISITEMGTPEIKPISFSITNDPSLPTRQITLQPSEILKMDTRYIVTIASGFPAADGHLGSTKAMTSQFWTYGDFVCLHINDSKYAGHNPKESIKIAFSNPVTYKQFREHVKFDPPIDFGDYSDSYKRTIFHIYGPFLPDTTYSISIDEAIRDVFGNSLKQPISVKLRTRSYDPWFDFPTGETVVEAYGDGNIPLELVNQDSLLLKIKSIPFSQIDVFGTMFRRQIHQLREDGFHGIVDSVYTIKPSIVKNHRHLFPVNVLSLNENSMYGVVYLQMSDPLTVSRAHWHCKPLLVQSTAMGITAKCSPVSNAIYVTRLKDSAPLAGVQVEVRDGTGKVYWTGTTDQAGYCQSPGWQRLEMPASRKRDPVQWIVAKHGDDIAYTHSEKGTGISPWEFNIPFEWNPRDQQLDAAIFTDRNIYRTEDSVRIKIVVREKFGLNWRLTERDTFAVHISDPEGKEVYKQTHRLNEFNAFNFTYVLPYEAARGAYSIQLDIPQVLNYNDRIYETFWVEDYRVPEFEVDVTTASPSFVYGDSLNATIVGRYLFGAPLKDAPVQWTIIKNHYNYSPPGWESYYFNPSRYFTQNRDGQGRFTTRTQSDKDTLDRKGAYALKQLLAEPNLLSNARYTIEGNVTDANRRRIAGRTEVTVYRGDYHVGIKPTSFFASKGKTFPLEVITASTEGKLIGNRRVEIKIIRRNWNSVQKVGSTGRLYWESKITDSTVVQSMLRTAMQPVSYQFKPEQSGYYLIRTSSVDDRGNTIVADCSIYVTGSDYVAWQRGDDDRIEMEIDKPKYSPGDVATVLVKSPFRSATALVTIEREGILDHWTQPAEGSMPTISVPIKENYLPNVYVSVMLIQGRTGNNQFDEGGNDIAKPAFKLGYTKLPVEAAATRLQVSVNTDREQYKPGEWVEIDLQAVDQKKQGKPTEFILAVVDKGILNLRNYRFPNLHAYFYRQRPLFVTTSESRLHIIGQRDYGEKGESQGGGGMNLANFEIRENFKGTAYWNPSVITDRNGKAHIRFKLPDNLTTFVIMVTGHTKESKFGYGEHSFIVNQPLIVQPALPRFARKGDTFSAGAVVNNNSDHSEVVTMQVKSAGIVLTGATQQHKIMLPPGKSEELTFTFEAEEPGNAEVSFYTTMGEHRDAVKRTIPIYQPITHEVVATSNSSTESARERIKIPQNAYHDMSTLDVQLATTQMVGLNAGIEYLFKYPYGCLEQQISRVLPLLLFEDVIQAFDLPGIDVATSKVEAQSVMDHLVDYQVPSGGFAYWQKADVASPYVTAWAAFAMIHAQKRGYHVSNKLMQEITDYLRSVLSSSFDTDRYPYHQTYWDVTRCLIAYDLALLDQSDYGYLDQLYNRRQNMPYFALGFLAQAMKQAGLPIGKIQTLTSDLFNGLRISPTTAHFEEPDSVNMFWCFHSNVRTTAHALQTLLSLEAPFPQAPQVVKWLLARRNKQGTWRTTQENIFVLHALNTYFKIYEKDEPDLKIAISLGTKEIMQSAFQGYSFDIQNQSVPLTPFTQGQEYPLSLKKYGKGRYYYELRMTSYPNIPIASRDNGISIVKKWDVLEGNIDKDGAISAGALLKITLTVASGMDRYYVVIDDPLPAGFEPVNTRLKTVADAYKVHKPLELSRSYWSGFNHYELHDANVLVFADRLPDGLHNFTYLCHALTRGRFIMPSTHVEEMYTPEVYGRTADRNIIIR